MKAFIKVQKAGDNKSIPKISFDRLFFFSIWPFGALVNALRNFRQPYAKTVFWIFCIYYGFVFINADPFGKGGADSARYLKQFWELHDKPLSFEILLSMFYNPKYGLTDIFQPIVTWLVSIFTDNQHILFAVFAAIFGYFWTQNLWIVFSRIHERISIIILLFMTGYALINPIWNINGVRMWTAAQIFIYGALVYLLDNKKKGLIWVAASVLVHFSFMFPAALFFVFLFLPNNLWVLFAFFVAASFIREINLKAVRDLLLFLPDIFQPKVESYTNPEYAKNVFTAQTELAWHVKLADLAERIFLYTWVVITFFKKKIWYRTFPDLKQLFGLALFMGGFAQIASLIPSGGRFGIISKALFYAVFLIIISYIKFNKIIEFLKLMTIPLLVFIIVFSIRVGLDFIGILTFFGNPFIAVFIDEQTPLIYFVKQLF